MTIPKIYIVGAGSIGSLIATALESTIPKTCQVSLILKSKEKLQDYLHHDSTLRLWRNIGSHMMIEREIPAHAQYPKVTTGGEERPLSIDNVIITTKATQTDAAIKALLPSITPSTNILLLQNGIGTYEQLCHKFWPDRGSRPSFLLGITSHGVRPTDIPWTHKHVGLGNIKLAEVPKDNEPLTVAHSNHHHSIEQNKSSIDRPLGANIVNKNAGEGVTPSVTNLGDPTPSEESVKADYSDLDVDLHHARRGSHPTDSEESVKSDYSELDINLQRARKGSATDSEESVKADYSELDITLTKARKGSQTDSEAAVKSDYEIDIRTTDLPKPNVELGSEYHTESEDSVKADYADDFVLPKKRQTKTESTELPFIFSSLLSTGGLLNAEVISYSQFQVAQFEKLIVNACINPLTVIFRCTNGKLLQIENSEKVLYDIVKESCNILKIHARETFPEDAQILVNSELNPHRMLRVVQDVCRSTAKNKSSMLIDVERGNDTELPYINDYLVQLGRLHKKKTDRNAMLAQLVRIQLELSRVDEANYIPLELNDLESSAL